MPEPTVEIIGVYKPVISTKTYQEQLEEHGDETDAYFDQLVLIETRVHDPDDRLNLIDWGQQPPWSEDSSRQMVPYDEGLLSADGTILIQREPDCVQGSGSMRFAFYLQCYSPHKPLLTSYGPVTCPPITPVPDRLIALMPYKVQT